MAEARGRRLHAAPCAEREAAHCAGTAGGEVHRRRQHANREQSAAQADEEGAGLEQRDDVEHAERR